MSKDPKEVKRARGSISTQITCSVNLLNRELSKKIHDGFDSEKISAQLVKTQKKRLSTHYELMQKLQERYLAVRDEGITDAAESALVEEDILYMEDIVSKVCPIFDMVDLYE